MFDPEDEFMLCELANDLPAIDAVDIREKAQARASQRGGKKSLETSAWLGDRTPFLKAVQLPFPNAAVAFFVSFSVAIVPRLSRPTAALEPVTWPCCDSSGQVYLLCIVVLWYLWYVHSGRIYTSLTKWLTFGRRFTSSTSLGKCKTIHVIYRESTCYPVMKNMKKTTNWILDLGKLGISMYRLQDFSKVQLLICFCNVPRSKIPSFKLVRLFNKYSGHSYKIRNLSRLEYRSFSFKIALRFSALWTISIG